MTIHFKNDDRQKLINANKLINIISKELKNRFQFTAFFREGPNMAKTEGNAYDACPNQ